MTNTGGVPAGWYHAPGDPEGTQRYWDGEQWIGEPQTVGQQAPAAPQTPPFAPPESGAGATSGAPVASAAPPMGQGHYAPAGVDVGVPSEWGTRAIAWLIDFGIAIAIGIVGWLLTVLAWAIADPLGVLMLLVSFVAYFGYFIWNFLIKQGATGQTIGKEQRGIKLVKDETGQPVGAGKAFVRYLIAGLIGSFCGIYTLLDYLWPLWDEHNKRLTDKMVAMSVVDVT